MLVVNSLTVVLADARPVVWLAVVLAVAGSTAGFEPTCYAVLFTDAGHPAYLGEVSYAVVLADARPAACLELASVLVVGALCAPLLHSACS